METRTPEVIIVKVGSHEVPIPVGDKAKMVQGEKNEGRTDTVQSAGLTVLSNWSDQRPQDGLTASQGRPNRRQLGDQPTRGAGPTGSYGQSDWRPSTGITERHGRSNWVHPGGCTGASSSSRNINKGHYIVPGTKPNSRWVP